MFSCYISSLGVQLNGQEPHLFMFHMNGHIITTYTTASSNHFILFRMACCEVRDSVAPESSWFWRKRVLDILYKEKSVLHMKALERLTWLTDALRRVSGKNFSESIPSYQVEREHVKYKRFKFLKSSVIELQFFCCSKEVTPKACLLYGTRSCFKVKFWGHSWSSFLFKTTVRPHQKTSTVDLFCSHLPLFPSLFGPEHKKQKKSFHYSTLDVMIQSMANHFFGVRRHSNVNAVIQNNPKPPKVCGKCSASTSDSCWAAFDKADRRERGKKSKTKWKIHLSSMVTRAFQPAWGWGRGREEACLAIKYKRIIMLGRLTFPTHGLEKNQIKFKWCTLCKINNVNS